MIPITTIITTALGYAGSYGAPALAFVTKHWKLIALVLALGGMGVTGFHLARSWDRERALVAQAATLRHRLSTITLLQASDAKRAKDNADALSKLKDAAIDTPANATACLPRASVRRVRAIR